MKKLIFLMMINIFIFNAANAEFLYNSTVTDTDTGLMWQNDAVGSTMTWYQAITYCEDKELGGYNDWRLPNNRELISISDPSTSDPAINAAFTQTASDYYWTSTTYSFDTRYARTVDFTYAISDLYLKTESHYVRCVRGVQ